MTLEEAIVLLKIMFAFWANTHSRNVAGMEMALNMAVSALRHQIWEDQLWHDAKTDPPKTPGLYYGKNDDTNSMYACQYRDGVWTLDMYPQQKMEIVQWADYTAFVQDNVEYALRPVSREQVERMRSRWITVAEVNGEQYSKCAACQTGLDGLEDAYLFCPHCGAPMTDEAVDIRLRELEALNDGKGD